MIFNKEGRYYKMDKATLFLHGNTKLIKHKYFQYSQSEISKRLVSKNPR